MLTKGRGRLTLLAEIVILCLQLFEGKAMGMKCPKCHSDNTDTARFCSNCAHPLPSQREIPVTKTLEIPKEDLTTGVTFAGRYQIIEELGKGGMGRVYKATDLEVKEKVAIKLIRPEITADEKTIERFRNELKLARKIIHKNICRMYDLNKEEDSYYITMEYIEGEDLKNMIQMSGQLDIGNAIRISRQVSEGLAEAHRQGVIHRDLKPSNIMIDREGNARIMDFGVARSTRAQGITAEGVIIGTPEYMSPEQVEGIEVDERSDIYSLGVILYEMVTGNVPFKGETALSIALKHKTEAPREPAELNAQIPEDLNRLILRCLEKEREKRFQNAEEVRSELNIIEREVPTAQRIIPWKRRVSIKARKIIGKKALVYSGASLITGMLIISGVYFLFLRGKPIDSIAVLPFDNKSQDAETEYISEGITETLIDRLMELSAFKKVIARTSVLRYKEKEIDPKVVGIELGVDAVLIGWMNQRGDAISIGAELVNTADSSLIWSNRYERKSTELYDIQQEITRSIIGSLQAKLRPEQRAQVERERPVNPDAYDAYLKAGYFARNYETMEEAFRVFDYCEKAIQLDPTYAPAYTRLARFYEGLGRVGMMAPAESFPRAREFALKALKIDEKNSSAHGVLALVRLFYDWDLKGARESIERALELDPENSSTVVLGQYSLYLDGVWQPDKSLSVTKRLMELDPFRDSYKYNYVFDCFIAGRYEESISQARKFLKNPEMRPQTLSYIHNALALNYAKKKMDSEALAENDRALDLLGSLPSCLRLSMIGYTYGILGRRDKATEILRRIETESPPTAIFSYKDPFHIAWVYSSLEDKDKAFACLEKAYEGHSPYLINIRSVPFIDNLRSDPRYEALLKKMGLEE
jgi:TolB-like protein/tRNA A-37 threonylcarbamoyl transferase component Bud32